MKNLLTALALFAAVGQAYNLYWANLHSHTGYSDGTSTPRHAFAFARDTAHIQILGVTDHAELLDSIEWSDVRAQADSATVPGSFVGLAGFEWTSVYLGHVNVLFTQDITDVFGSPTMPELYRWLYERPGTAGQFNHPGPDNYDTFAYSETGDVAVALYDMHDSVQADRFHVPLDSGWRIGAVSSQDNHDADWGAGNKLAGIWADSLEPGSIRAALRQMRTFGTQDRNLALRLFANDSWMGSTIENGSIHFRVEAADLDSLDYIAQLAIITNGGVVLDSLLVGNSSHVAWECSTTTSPGERRYFFCRVIENDRARALSSPVWTDDPTALESARRESRPALRVRPNPFRSSSVVIGHEFEVFPVYDISGSVVARCRGDRVGSDLEAGVYFLRVAGFSNLRLVKLR
jgi:hypothetical protein